MPPRPRHHAAGPADHMPPPPPPRMHHHESRFLEALDLIVRSGRARTTEDLIRYAEQAGERFAADYLRSLVPDQLPVDLAFDALEVQVRIAAYKRNNRLLDSCQARMVALVLPLPPHVMDSFLPLNRVMLLCPEAHRHLPPHLQGAGAEMHVGGRACRAALAQAETVVFEAYKAGETYFVDAVVADLLDPRLLPAETRLIMHLRPHRDPADVPYVAGSRPVEIL